MRARFTKQEEYIKKWRRVAKYTRKLDTSLVYIPVEEPEHVGWEVTVKLSESGMRRRDAGDIMELINITGLTRPRFSRHESSVRAARQNRRYTDYIKEWRRRSAKHDRFWCGWYGNTYDGFVNLNPNPISEYVYERLPEHLKHYFYNGDIYFSTWQSKKEYNLRQWKIPFHELIVKVKRAYSTHRGIPQGYNDSEYDIWSDRLWHGEGRKYYTSKNGFKDGGGTRYQRYQVNRFRNRWRHLNRILVNGHIDVEEYEQRAVRLPKRIVRYGYW